MFSQLNLGEVAFTNRLEHLVLADIHFLNQTSSADHAGSARCGLRAAAALFGAILHKGAFRNNDKESDLSIDYSLAQERSLEAVRA